MFKVIAHIFAEAAFIILLLISIGLELNQMFIAPIIVDAGLFHLTYVATIIIIIVRFERFYIPIVLTKIMFTFVYLIPKIYLHLFVICTSLICVITLLMTLCYVCNRLYLKLKGETS